MRIAYLGEATSLARFSPLQSLHGSPVTNSGDVCGSAGGSSTATCRKALQLSAQNTSAGCYSKMLLKYTGQTLILGN